MENVFYTVALRRTGDPSDLIAVLNACSASLPEIFPTRDHVEVYVERIARRAVILEARRDRALGGFAAFYCNDEQSRRAFLTMICVAPDHQRRGLATALLRSAIDYARAQGFRYFDAKVAKVNRSSLQLHRSLGFELVGEESREFVMTLALFAKSG